VGEPLCGGESSPQPAIPGRLADRSNAPTGNAAKIRPRNNVTSVKILSAASMACFHSSMKTWSLFWYAAFIGNEC
jgi:hypothetical protein